jgi:hypothetical protein
VVFGWISNPLEFENKSANHSVYFYIVIGFDKVSVAVN